MSATGPGLRREEAEGGIAPDRLNASKHQKLNRVLHAVNRLLVAMPVCTVFPIPKQTEWGGGTDRRMPSAAGARSTTLRQTGAVVDRTPTRRRLSGSPQT